MSRYWQYSGSSIAQLAQQAPHLRRHMEWLAWLYKRGVMLTSDGQQTKEGVDWLREQKVTDERNIGQENEQC